MVDELQVYDTWVALYQASAMLERALDLRLRPWNVSGPQVAALTVMSVHGPQRMSDLARYLLQQTQTTTDLIDRLEQRGLVRRVRHATDRRVVLVEVTDTARAMLKEIDNAGFAVGMEAISQVSSKELDRLTSAIRTIRDQAAELGGVPREHLAYAEERLRVVPSMALAAAAS